MKCKYCQKIIKHSDKEKYGKFSIILRYGYCSPYCFCKSKDFDNILKAEKTVIELLEKYELHPIIHRFLNEVPYSNKLEMLIYIERERNKKTYENDIVNTILHDISGIILRKRFFVPRVSDYCKHLKL